MHLAEIPIRSILACLPAGYQLNGLWVQTKHDGTLDHGGPVKVSIQYGWPGSWKAESGDGATVAAAGQHLVERLRVRYGAQLLRQQARS